MTIRQTLRIASTFILLAAAAPHMAATTATAAADPGWPRAYTTPAGARVQIYQPQIASWEGQTHLVAYLAVAHTAAGADGPCSARSKSKRRPASRSSNGSCSFADVADRRNELRIAGRASACARSSSDIERAMPEFERVIALDRVLAGLDRSQIRASNVDGVKADPPAIFFSTTPAVLVDFDGEPIWSPIEGNDLKYRRQHQLGRLRARAVEDVVSATRRRLAEGRRDRPGRGRRRARCPPSFAKLPVRRELEGRQGQPRRAARSRASDTPAVFVSTSPAELILLRGAPSYLLVSGDRAPALGEQHRQRRVPPGQDRPRLLPRGRPLVLGAGLQRSVDVRDADAAAATSSASASNIRARACSRRCRARAQAAEAVVLAQIPQTAQSEQEALAGAGSRAIRASRSSRRSSRRRSRAPSTPTRTSSGSATSTTCASRACGSCPGAPHGPWEVASAVPPQIYQIPAELAVASRHLRHRRRGRRRLGRRSRRGAGYTGVTIAWGCAVWGTGWYYPPYVWYGGSYPVYYPYLSDLRRRRLVQPVRPASTSAAPWRTDRTAAPARRARYNPATGTYARGAVAWGPYGAEGAAQAYNPRTGAYAQTRQGAGVYGSWGSSYVQRGDDWAQTARVTNNVTGDDHARHADRRRRAGQPQRPQRQRVRRRRRGRRVCGARRQRLSPRRGRLAEVRERRLGRGRASANAPAAPRERATPARRPMARRSASSIAIAPRASKARSGRAAREWHRVREPAAVRVARRGRAVGAGVSSRRAQRGHTGLASSIRHGGAPSDSGPSNLTNAGASPPRIHTCESGGCLPSRGATIPARPPISIFTT